MATGLTQATITVSADTRAMERDIAKSLRTVEFSQINTKKSSQALGRITGQVSEFNKSLEASNARVIAFGASAGAIFAVERAITSLITTTIEVEKKLQDVNVLLNLSSSNLEKFGSSLFSIARNTAQSFASVADAAVELARQGLGVEETLRRTNAALILARLSGLDTVKSVEALTATINSFSNSALDATQIVNKLANVDAAFAVSSADLANAISRVGSTAQDAGVSFDELISIVTAAQQTTARGGAVIGNSLKTIFTRLQRGKVQSLLESLGVDTGEGQSAVSLLQQLASVYDELSASQKSFVAEQVGGVFQINILKASLADLGKQYSIYGRALDTSLSSTDQAIKRNEELNKTVSALSSQAVANLQQAADKIGSIIFEPNAKNFLSGFNGVLESFNSIDSESQGGKFIEGFFKGISNFIGGPGTVLAVAVITKLFLKLTQFAAGSARELLGRNEATKQQAALEQSVLSILQKNSQFTNQILTGKMSTLQAEKQLLAYLTAQSNIMKEQERLSKIIAGNLGRSGLAVSAAGVPTVRSTKSAGFVPNFASEMAVGQAMENAGAKQHGYKAGKARKTRIHDGNGKSFSSFVNSREDVVNFKNAAGKKATIVRPPNGFGENTEFAAGGFIPNFVNVGLLDKFSAIKNKLKQSNEDAEKTGSLPRLVKNDDVSLSGGKFLVYYAEPLQNETEVAYESRILAGLSKSGYVSNAGAKLYQSANSSIDGLKAPGSSGKFEFAEIKKGGYNYNDVYTKMLRALPENYGTGNILDKWTTGKDKFQVEGLLIQGDNPKENSLKFQNNAKKAIIGSYAYRVDQGKSSEDAKSYIRRVRGGRSINSGGKLKPFSSGFVPNFVGGRIPKNLNIEYTKPSMLGGEIHPEQSGYVTTFSNALDAPISLRTPAGNQDAITANRMHEGAHVAAIRYGDLLKKYYGKPPSQGLKTIVDNLRGMTYPDMVVEEGFSILAGGFNGLPRQTFRTKEPKSPKMLSDLRSELSKTTGLPISKIDQGVGILNKLTNKYIPPKEEADYLSSGFVPNFAGAKMQAGFRAIMAKSSDEDRSKSIFASKASKEASLKSKRGQVKDIGDLAYTMIHPENVGLQDTGEIDYLKKDKKTGLATRYFGKFKTSGLSSSDVAKKANAGALQNRVSSFLLGEANQFARIFNPGSSFSDIGEFSDKGAVMTAVGTVFESSIRKAFNQEAVSKNQDFDFPSPNGQLRDFFGNAPGPYEAKGSKSMPNMQDSLGKWVRNKGLSGGFIPNFAPGIITGDAIRGNEYKAVLDYLAKTSKPIRTILGPSGVGKTTMASKLGGKIAKSFSDLDLFDSYILDRASLDFPKDPLVAENLKKIFSKSNTAGSLDVLLGSRNTIKSLRERRAASGDALVPNRAQLPVGTGGISSFVKGVRDFKSQYPGANVSRMSKSGEEYNLRKILSSGFLPNFAKTGGLSFSQSKMDEFGFTSLSANLAGKKVGSFEYSEDKPGTIDVGDITVDKSQRGKGYGQSLYQEAIKRNPGKMMTGQILPQTARFLAKLKAGQPVSAETLYPQMKRAQLAKKAIFEVWGHKEMGEEEEMSPQKFKSFVEGQIMRLKSDPGAFIDFFGDVQGGNYDGIGVQLKTQHAAGFIPNFAESVNIAYLEKIKEFDRSSDPAGAQNIKSLKNKISSAGYDQTRPVKIAYDPWAEMQSKNVQSFDAISSQFKSSGVVGKVMLSEGNHRLQAMKQLGKRGILSAVVGGIPVPNGKGARPPGLPDSVKQNLSDSFKYFSQQVDLSESKIDTPEKFKNLVYSNSSSKGELGNIFSSFESDKIKFEKSLLSRRGVKDEKVLSNPGLRNRSLYDSASDTEWDEIEKFEKEWFDNSFKSRSGSFQAGGKKKLEDWVYDRSNSFINGAWEPSEFNLPLSNASGFVPNFADLVRRNLYDWDGTIIPKIVGKPEDYINGLNSLKEKDLLPIGKKLKKGKKKFDILTSRPPFFEKAIGETATRLGLPVNKINFGVKPKDKLAQAQKRGSKIVDDDLSLIGNKNYLNARLVNKKIGKSKSDGFVPNFLPPQIARGGKFLGKGVLEIAAMAALDGIITGDEIAILANSMAGYAGPALAEMQAKVKDFFGKKKVKFDKNINPKVVKKVLGTPTLPLPPNYYGNQKNSFSSGFVPNFGDALRDAIGREKSAGLSSSQIYVDKHSSLKNKNNPMGLMVANTRDEPMGGFQGIKRAKKEGRNPKTYGASAGFVPNFASEDAGGGNENAIAGLVAGLQGLAFTAVMLTGQMRAMGEAIKLSAKSASDLSSANQKSQQKVETLSSSSRSSGQAREFRKFGPGQQSQAVLVTAQEKATAVYERQKREAIRQRQSAIDAQKNLSPGSTPEQQKAAADRVQSSSQKTSDLIKNRDSIIQSTTNKVQASLNDRVRVTQQLINSERAVIQQNKLAIQEEKNNIAAQKKQRGMLMAQQGLMAAQIFAPQIASFIPRDTQNQRGSAATVEGFGNIAGMAGMGMMMGGPWGAAAGGAVAALMEIPKIEKAFTSKMPELEKAVTAATERFTKFSEGGQAFLGASEKLSTIKANPNSSAQDVVAAEKQYIDSLSALPTKYQEQLVAAERLGNAQQVYARILEGLSVEKQEKEVAASTKKVSEDNKTGILGTIGDVILMAGLVGAAGVNAATGGLASGFQMNQSDYENSINAIDYSNKYGKSTSQENIKSIVTQTSAFTRVSDDPTTDTNEALVASQDLAKAYEGVQKNITDSGGVNTQNFESQKSALINSLRSAYEKSGDVLTSGERDILSNLSETFNRPDQLESWLAAYQSENNQFISAQEKIAEVNKNIAEKQKKEAEKQLKLKQRSDERGARVSAASANMDRVFSDFQFALDSAMSDIDFSNSLKKNTGLFGKDIYDAVNMPNASREIDKKNRIFDIQSVANSSREKLKVEGAENIFQAIGDTITSASLNESQTSSMNDTEKNAALQNFELSKLGFKNELMGSGALEKILKGDTSGANQEISSLIDKMAASGNFTATQIQDLKNKTVSQLGSIAQGIKTSNKNEQQQKALLAQQLVQERVKERITGAQNFGGGSEDMINSLLGSPESLFNKASDALASAVGGGFDVRNLKEDSDGKVVNSKTGEKIAKDQAGAAANFYDMITQYAGAPVTSMDDIGIKAISQARNDQLYSQVDQLEKQAGGAVGPEVFQNIRKRLDEDLGGKNGEVGKLQALKRFGSIDGDQYINKLTSKYKDEAFKDLPSELQAAYKAASGDTSLQLLEINKLTEVSKAGFGDVVGAITNSFDINKISDGIKQGLIANQVAEKKIAAEQGAADSNLTLVEAEASLNKKKLNLDPKEKQFSSASSAFSSTLSDESKARLGDVTDASFWKDTEKVSALDKNFSQSNVEAARSNINIGSNVESNKKFVDQAQAYQNAKKASEELSLAKTAVSQSESDVASAKGKSNAASALVQDYKSVTSDQTGLDRMTQLYSENKNLTGKGYFTPGQNYMNPSLLPKQGPLTPPTPVQPSPIQQALATGGANNGSIMQPNLTTSVGSINVPVSITMQPQTAAAAQGFQEAQSTALNQGVEQLRSEVQALAERFASTQTELQNKGVVSPKPPTTPAVKPRGVAP